MDPDGNSIGASQKKLVVYRCRGANVNVLSTARGESNPLTHSIVFPSPRRNGVLAAQSPGRIGAVRVVGAEWAVGAQGGGGDRHWRGCIAHAALYRAARGPEDLARSARAGAPSADAAAAAAAGLVGHWPLDDGGGRSARDALEDCGRDGEIRGGCTWTLASSAPDCARVRTPPKKNPRLPKASKRGRCVAGDARPDFH
jgi:hypothetical protein